MIYEIRMIHIFKKKIKEYFGKEMKMTGKYTDFKWKESFLLEYKYLPYNYNIKIDHESGLFMILIDDGGKASTSLNRISGRIQEKLNAENIDVAISELRRVLDSNNFPMYFYEGEDVFEKKPNGQVIKI